MRYGLVLDIETVPETLEFDAPITIPEEFYPPFVSPKRRTLPRNYRAGSEAAERWEASETARIDYAIAEGKYQHQKECQEKYLRLALNPRRCRVVAWAVAPIHTTASAGEVVSACGQDERDLLASLEAHLERYHRNGLDPCLLAWNGPAFDYRVLYARMRRWGLAGRRRYAPRPYNGRVFWSGPANWDLMPFAPGAVNGRLSKAEAAKNWKIELQTDDGSQVPRHWIKGNLARIEEHCREDVLVERKLAWIYDVPSALGLYE